MNIDKDRGSGQSKSRTGATSSSRSSNSTSSSQERLGSYHESGKDHRNSSGQKRYHHWDKDVTSSKSESSKDSRSISPVDDRKRRRRSRSPKANGSRSREDNRSKQYYSEKGPAARAREQSRFELRQEFAKQHDEQERSKAGLLGLGPNYKPTRPTQPATTATKLVEEIEKRKTLFSKKVQGTEPSDSVWKSTTLTDDSDGKMTAKFKRLMGIKGADSEAASSEKPQSSNRGKEEYLANLEKQYEVARTITHTQRGVGLGFSSIKPSMGSSRQ